MVSAASISGQIELAVEGEDSQSAMSGVAGVDGEADGRMRTSTTASPCRHQSIATTPSEVSLLL